MRSDGRNAWSLLALAALATALAVAYVLRRESAAPVTLEDGAVVLGEDSDMPTPSAGEELAPQSSTPDDVGEVV